mmetsp:Transcript_24462/g.50778  ORF Transcript_24462/g.50778 Transcript_24462/m.50778 type:complete len:395 (+) Transcript_24462:165-1349(+)
MPKRYNDDDEVDGIEEAEGDYEDEQVDRERKKKKKKKVKIMGYSNQTEADRRVLRQKQRELQQDIAIGGGESSSGGVEDPNSGELERVREKNNELWNEVRYTREAVLDSENMDLITSKAARQVERIVQVPRYDAIRLAQILSKKATVRTPSGATYFGWQGLGFQVGVCFNSLPTHVSFLNGPLGASYQPKERQKPERRARQKVEEEDDAEDEQPDDADQAKKKESDGNELSAVEKHISIISSTLKKRYNEEVEAAYARKAEYIERVKQDDDEEKSILKKEKLFVRAAAKVDAVKYLFNPHSFTQTVENIFHFSFLVKNGVAGIKVRATEESEEYGLPPGPVIMPIEEGSGHTRYPTQAIVSLNMKDWKDMCKAFSVTESDVPNRRTPKKKDRNY